MCSHLRSKIPKHLDKIKALCLRPRAYIYFSAFGTREEALVLVFDILHEKRLRCLQARSRCFAISVTKTVGTVYFQGLDFSIPD